MQVPVQGAGAEGLAHVVLKGLCPAPQRPVVLCRDAFLTRLCLRLFFFEGSLSAGDGLGVQVRRLCPLFFEVLHAGEGDAEALCELSSCMPALQGLDDAFAKIEGGRFHAIRIAQAQHLREEL